MRNESVALAVLLLALQGSASAGDVLIEEQLNSLLGNAANTIANPNATPQQQKEATETINFGSAAKGINAMKVSVEEKNRLCQSKGKALSNIVGYDLGFFLGKCNEVFK